MTIRVAIIADDLTGALDTAAPFVRHGLRVAIVWSIDRLQHIADTDTDVVVINTGSRELAEAEAASRVLAAARAVAEMAPEIVFKKIDSRLKGHVAAETAALCQALGVRQVLVAPAVPDQQRPTRGGMVTGAGVGAPIPIAPIFAGFPVPSTICDAETDADLDAIAARIVSSALAVGARGLGQGLARRLGRPRADPLLDVATSRVLIAVGSRDAIANRQVAHLRVRCPEIGAVEAIDGHVPPIAAELPLLVRCGGPVVLAEAAAVARRFAEGIARLVRETTPECLWITGGETALAILSELTISSVNLLGEIAPGVPLIACTAADGTRMRCVVKSGGFGEVDLLEAAFRRR